MKKLCPKCGSKDIKEVDSPEDFLSTKPEGEPAKRGTLKTEQKYHCNDCGKEWEDEIK